MLNSLDLAKLNGNEKTIGLFEEALSVCPELGILEAFTVPGTSYTTAVRTSRPTAGFRGANTGTDSVASTFRKQLVQMYILSGHIVVDKAIADGYEGGAGELQALESAGIAQEVFKAVSKQIYNGTSADSEGFSGLRQVCEEAGTARTIVSDCTGSATEKASVYLVRNGKVNGVSLVYGRGTTLDLGDFREETALDANNKPFPAYVADICGWLGLQVRTPEAVMRIANVGVESGKSGISDALIAKALSKWVGPSPTHIFMNRTARYLLQASRSVTIMAGPRTRANVDNFAEAPSESNGIPIVVTDGIEAGEDFVS